MKSTISKRSVVIVNRKTSVSLENEFWSAVREIAAERKLTVRALVSEISSQTTSGNLSSAVRIFVLDFYRERAMAMQADDEQS